MRPDRLKPQSLSIYTQEHDVICISNHNRLKPKSLSTSTQEHDVICRDSVNTGIAPEALVEDVIVREAYKVFSTKPTVLLK